MIGSLKSPQLAGRLGLRQRMALGFGMLVALLLLLSAGLALLQMRGVGELLTRIVETHNRRADLAHQLYAAQLDWMGQLRALIVLTEPEDLAAQQAELQAAQQRYGAAEKALAAALEDSAVAEMQQRLDDITRLRTEVEPALESTARTALAGMGAEAALGLLIPAEDAAKRWRELIAGIVAQSHAANQNEYATAQSRQRLAMVMAAAVAAAAWLFATVMALGLMRSITRPVSQAVAAAERIAQGRLDEEVFVERHDEFGRLLQAIGSMQQRLRETVAGLQASGRTVDGASSEIGTGTRELSVRTEQAAARLQQTAASVRVLAQAVAQTARDAREASTLADAVRQEARQGDAAVTQLHAQMCDIAAASSRITEIVGVIDAIAFQTNLLALNAAVEAARAGEQGRGFGVVAAEVRSLASRAAEAAGQIRALSADVSASVNQGAHSADQAGATVSRLAGAASEVARTVRAIAESASTQTGALQEVDRAVDELDQATQRNTALAEELAASTSGLKEHAGALERTLRRFRLARPQAPAASTSRTPARRTTLDEALSV